MPKDRERLLRALFDRAPEAIVIADHTRRIVDINETMVEMFGYHIDEIAGEPTAVLYADPLDFQESGRAVFSQNVPAAEAPGVLRQRYKRKDGSVFNARTVAMQLRDANGHVRGFAGRIEDMSDRDAEHSAEVEALSTERALLDALYRKTPAMLFATDTEGSIEHISDSLADRLGVSAAEAFGRAWTDFLMEPSATRPGDLFREVEQAGRIVDTPHRLRGRDGVLVEVELSATLETSGQHQRVLAILGNVTARNRAIKELESRNAQMRQFARIAAHDLRTPLRHISLFADDVHKALEHADVPDVLDDLGVIRKSAERLSEMVKGLLEFSVTNEKKIVP
ncbi:MAG: PAS domain S-box protein, partial [Pseudomonadota bacterium]